MYVYVYENEYDYKNENKKWDIKICKHPLNFEINRLETKDVG